MIEIILLACLILLSAIVIFWKKPSHLIKDQSRANVGGLVGRMEGGTIRRSHSQVKIRMRGSPERSDVGGLVGSMSGDSLIEDSTSDSDIEFFAESLDDILYNRPLKIWVIGGFFLTVFLCIFITIYYVQSLIHSPWRVAILWFLSLTNYIVITAVILKFFSKIHDESFFNLIKIAAVKLPKSLKLLLKNTKQYFKGELLDKECN